MRVSDGIRTSLSRRLPGLVLIGVCSLGFVPQSSAQIRLQVTPYFAAHFPARPFFVTDVASPRVTLTDNQGNAPALGAKLAVWLSPRFAIEGDVNYAWSGVVESRDPADSLAFIFLTTPGNVVTATSRLVYRPRRSNLLLGLGGGIMHRGGEAWDESRYTAGTRFETDNFTGVVSVGFLANVTRGLTILASIEALLYSVEKIDLSDVTVPLNPHEAKAFQADIQIKLGVPIGAR